MRVFPFFLVLLASCKQESDIVKVSGEAQGTTYHISYLSPPNENYKEEIDSLLKTVDLSLSTYVPYSIISRINRNDSTVMPDRFFVEVFNKAQEVSQRTGGAFDVTVAPLINAWGFGFKKKEQVTGALIDSLLQFVGYQNVRLGNGKLIKNKPQVMVDFNALAQGYTVDLLAALLESKGINNYLVELGGEVKAKGKKNKNEFWKIGIDKPVEGAEGRPLNAIITLQNRALATSGNYRKYYVEKGRKFSHIIDPKTGYPAKHHLLSATVIADDCMTADAYATAFMVMGMVKAKEFLSIAKDLNLQVFFIYDENGARKTYASENLKEAIEEL